MGLSTWVRNELRLSTRETATLVNAAATCAHLPAVAEAAAAGQIRAAHVATFTYGLKHIGHKIVTESESWLLEVANTCEPNELFRVIRALRDAIYPDQLITSILGYISCNSDMTAILLRGNTDVLDVGRTYRLATLKQRRAVIVRQGGQCATPGCHNTHLEMHHPTWWSQGGPLLTAYRQRCDIHRENWHLRRTAHDHRQRHTQRLQNLRT